VDVSIPLAAFGLGVALGASPGPVQLLLFSEASRGGAGRGLRAMAGANATFGLMMLLLAAGLSSLEPGETFLRVVNVIGGAFLVFLAVDAIREGRRPQVVEDPRGTGFLHVYAIERDVECAFRQTVYSGSARTSGGLNAWK